MHFSFSLVNNSNKRKFLCLLDQYRWLASTIPTTDTVPSHLTASLHHGAETPPGTSGEFHQIRSKSALKFLRLEKLKKKMTTINTTGTCELL